MASSNGGKRPPRRPAAGSRNPTSRPHKIAGLGDEGTESPASTDSPASPVSLDKSSPPPPAPPETGWPDEYADPPDGGSSSARTTIALVVVVLLLVAVATTEGWYLWVGDDDDVSADRPVVASALDTGSAVDSAAKSLQAIGSVSYKNYDEHVDAATSKMTAAFAEKYRLTAEDIQAEFVLAKTEVAIEITGQGVVTASPEQVQALIFMTQLVTKNGKGLTSTPYRSLVTVKNTDQGWLVSDIETG